MSNQVEMPKYKCHKEVWALKIKDIRRAHVDGEGIRTMIVPEDDGYGVFAVSDEFVERHNPKVGGYYVVYEDGYRSYSPAEAFEKGYTRIGGILDA